MKKLYLLLGLLLAFAVGSYAADAAVGTDVVMDFQLDTTLSVDDTLTADGDSITLVTNLKCEAGYNYLLVTPAITGGGSDSVDIDYHVRCMDEEGTTLYSIIVDTDTDATSEAIDLSLGTMVLSRYINIYAVASSDIGSETIVDDHQIGKRRPVQVQRRW